MVHVRTLLSPICLTLLVTALLARPAWAMQTPPVVENCNRSENPLASGWSGAFDPDVAGVWQANGTECRVSADAQTYWGTIQAADHFITASLSDAVASGTQQAILYVRLQQPSAVSNTVDTYQCRFTPLTPEISIRETTNGGTSALLAGPVTQALASGDGIACQIIGNTISAWHQPGGTGDWFLRLQVTDASITGPGYVGMQMTSSSLALDNIGFGPVSSNRLGLHYTDHEVPLWEARAASGPYAAEWTAILASANTFISAGLSNWLGNQLNVAWNGDAVRDGTQPPNVYPDGATGDNRKIGDTLRDAAFVSRVTGDTAYLTPVRNWLIAQAAISGTNFANTTKWSTTYLTLDKDFTISIWLRKLTYAYSYIRPSVSASDQTTLDAWFNTAATYWSLVLHNAAKTRFPNRLTGDYTTVSFSCAKPVGGSSAVTHFGGYEVDQFGFPWDNKRMNFAAMVAGVGAMTGNTTLIADAKRMFQEWLRSNIFPDGTSWEQARWTTPNPQSGWSYAHLTVGAAAALADHIARTGDTELYTHTTSLGNCGSEGGTKSLLLALQRLANMTLGNVLVYASLTSTSDPNLLIDSDGPGGALYLDTALAQPNVYYRDPLLLASYIRTMPATSDPGGYDALGGDWGHLPRARFMFGQMEGIHNPYVLPASLLGPNYHVAKTGSDAVSCANAQNWGTDPSQAKLTIQAGLACATAPGDVVNIHVGTYVETPNSAASGTSADHIVMQPWPGDAVTIQGDLTIAHDWMTVRGLTISTAALRIQAGANDVQILGVTVTNTPTNGILLDGAAGAIDNILISGCTITAAGVNGIRCDVNDTTIQETDITIENCTISGNGLNGIHLGNTTGAIIRNNVIQNNGSRGIYITELSDNTLIEQNTIRNNGRAGIEFNAVPAGTAPPISGAEDFTISRNLLQNNAMVSGPAQISIDSAGTPTARSVISNNVIVGSTTPATDGIAIFRGIKIDLFHNTIYNPTRWGVLGRCYRDGVIQNNIVVGPDRAFSAETSTNDCTGYANGLITEDYNLLRTSGASLIRWTTGTSYATLAAYQAATAQGVHSVDRDPQFAILP